jgi:hypothetical protein
MKIYEILLENIEQQSHKEFDDKHPELIAAAQKVHDGEMTSKEYWKLVGKYRPVTPYEQLPVSATKQDLERGLTGKGQAKKIEAEIPEGQIVHLRLDIPAYTRHNVWAPTIHAGTSTGKIGDSISHKPTAIVNNAAMHILHDTQIDKKGHPIHIARGEISKYPLATITGAWENATTEEAREQANLAMKDPEWIQVGMDPRRHSFFYDRSNRRPVLSGSKVIQVGGLILLKNPKYGKRSDFTYEEGLSELFKNLDQEIINELTFHGRQCTDDCSGHKAGYEWETRNGKKTGEQPPTFNTIPSATKSPSFNSGTEIAINKRNKDTGYVPPASMKGDKGKFVKYAGRERYPDKFKQPVSQPQPPLVPPVPPTTPL